MIMKQLRVLLGVRMGFFVCLFVIIFFFLSSFLFCFFLFFFVFVCMSRCMYGYISTSTSLLLFVMPFFLYFVCLLPFSFTQNVCWSQVIAETRHSKFSVLKSTLFQPFLWVSVFVALCLSYKYLCQFCFTALVSISCLMEVLRIFRSMKNRYDCLVVQPML